MQATTNRTERAELTANEVAQICGNNESRLFKVASYLGVETAGSWFIAATNIAADLNNVAADPADTLRHILTQI